MDNTMSAGDILALTRDNNAGGNFWWIIVFLIVAGMFGGFGGFGFGNSGANFASDEFIKRDIFSTNQNVSANGTANVIETLNAKYDNAVGTLNTANQTQREILENRYTTQLGFANSNAASQNCCCELKQEVMQNRYDNALQTQTLSAQANANTTTLANAVHAEGESTRALINANRIADLEYQLNQANTAVANAVQTQNILSAMGNYYPRAGVNPYYIYGGYGVSSIV